MRTITPPAAPERYVATSRLGEGGMAEVYRAWDRHTESWRAIKILYERYATQPSSRQRFIDEGRTVMDLDHRNVIDALDLVERPARPFLVMEIAEGGSLHQWVDRHGRMAPRLAVDVAVQISKGIGAAHRIGVVHRDVKPHNILLSRRGQCKVIDFGIAQILRSDGTTDIPDARSLNTQHAMGTLGYMAPEQRTDPRSADVRTDVYGIGATLYTLLTGRVVTNLFIADRDPALLEGIPEAIIPVLMRATAYKPEQRYGSVQELAKALFDVGGLLPPDPPDRPGLAPELGPEPPPPRGESVGSVPASQAPTPVSVPRQRGAPTPPSMPRRPSPTPPSAPRRDPGVLPPPSWTPPPARRVDLYDDDTTEDLPTQRTRPLVVLMSLGLLMILVGVLDMIHVNRARDTAFFAAQGFRTSVQDQSSVIDVLQLAGVETQPLEQYYDALFSAPGPQSTADAGSAYLQALQQATSTVDDTRTTDRVGQKLKLMTDHHDRLTQGVSDWDGASRCLGLASGLGLSSRPY